MKEKLMKLECKRCGYKWIPRKTAKPRMCPNPKCHSAYWDLERIYEKRKT